MIQYIFFLIVGILLIVSGIYAQDTQKILRAMDVVFGIVTIFIMLFKLIEIC